MEKGRRSPVQSRSAHLLRKASPTHRDANNESTEALAQVYDEAMSQMRPKYGHWVIFEHCMPFNVSRTYDEAKGLDHPRIWTAERDVEMWKALEHGASAKSGEI